MKTFKRFFCGALVWLLALSMIAPALAATIGVDVNVTAAADKSSYQVGDTVYVSFTQDVALSSLAGYELIVNYDHTALEWLESESVNGSGSATVTYVHQQDKSGQHLIKLAGVDLAGTISIPTGEISKLAFRVLKTGTTELTHSLEIMDANYDLYDGANITPKLSLAVQEAPAVKGYTLTAAADFTANVGENVSVAFTVGNTEETVTEYNAYDLSFTYDNDKLTYVSAAAADADASIDAETAGVIRVIGYGESKKFDTAAVTLNFTTKAAGETNVTATAASIDNRANAPDKDTPAAARVDDTTLITVEEKFTVNLGDGLTADSLVAESGKDFHFRATDADHYDYTVTAVLTGTETPVTVTDNGDGTYTIRGDVITGPMTVTAVMTGKEQTVKVEGSGAGDVTAALTANYGTDYTFTVNQQVGYKYTVAATVNGSEVALNSGENGAYTIAGAHITGPVVIAVTKTQEGSAPSHSVSKPAYVSGAETATEGEDYTFSILPEAGYSYSEPEVTVGGEKVTVTKNENGSYTIAGADVTGDIVIKVTRTSEKGVAVTEYITLNEQSMYLITVSNVTGEGNIAKYAGHSMYWSAEYGAYAWLVVSNKSLAEMETEADNNVTIEPGTAADDVHYTGDVNMTDKTDVNDAQLTYDMYKARYASFDTVSMQKFLNADINGDRAVDTSDAAAIVDVIKTTQTA